MSNENQALKPEGYDVLVGEIVSLIQQFQVNPGVNAKPLKATKKKSIAPKRPSREKLRKGQS